MSQRVYLKPKKTSGEKAQRLFSKGLAIGSAILISLEEAGEEFLRSLPSSYPSFKLVKDIFGIQGYGYSKLNDSTVRANMYRLRQQGLIVKDPKQKIYYLTPKGKKAAMEIKSRYAQQASDRSWDGKFRIFAFDIPEKKKGWREAIRRELAVSQFRQLQESVYIGKYPLPEDFYQELEDNNILQHIFLLTVGEIDRQKDVLRLFERG